MKKSFLVLIAAIATVSLYSQKIRTTKDDVPVIGAQVFIEPGQTDAQIDSWFKILADNNMNVCRIRMFGLFMKDAKGNWDFSLFDRAFRAADRYNVKIYATLFPTTAIDDTGGFKQPKSVENQREIADYIKAVVTHFSTYKCLYAWVLMNEPGKLEVDLNESFTKSKFEEWKKNNPQPVYSPDGFYLKDMDYYKFITDYQTWYLGWLADQVKLYDTNHELHANPHQIFSLAMMADMPAYRKFLTTLGGSAHPQHHFPNFDRNKFDIAMSGTSEIFRSGAGELPWLMTELPGGNTVYIGSQNFLCGTQEEITQYLWIVLATEGKKGIFWTLNARGSGKQSGEVSLLNFNNEPSDRFLAAARVVKAVNSAPQMFAKARTEESGISVLYVRESMWIENDQGSDNPKPDYYARHRDAGMHSTVGIFETLTQMGYQVNYKEIREYDFTRDDYTGKVIFLSNQRSLSPMMIGWLEDFVRKSGQLIVDGLTGYYDDQMVCRMMYDFPLKNLFGAIPLEFKVTANLFPVSLTNGKELTGHCWRGFIRTTTATPIATYGNDVLGSKNSFGKGEVYWIPTPIGLGTKLSKNYAQLAAWLDSILPKKVKDDAFRFDKFQNDGFMKTMRTPEGYLSVVINKDSKTKQFAIHTPSAMHSSIFFADKGAKVNGNKVTVSPEETALILWKK